MNKSILIDTRMKSKIESLTDCSVKFKDLMDTFWFNDKNELQEFLNKQSVERFYDAELKKGYFDYINEYGEILRYHVESKRGTLKLLKEECLSNK